VQSLMRVAGRALRANLAALGPRVLPLGEQLRYAADTATRRLLAVNAPPYLPDFNRAFEHLCLHTGALLLGPRI
jgi:3-ketoacyl-CoA synthase